MGASVGYYTEVAGLGASPTDVTINGHVDVYNQCDKDANGNDTNCLALNNFWRSLSNLTINVTGATGCRSAGNFWAVSQASPMRRVNVTGGILSLMDFCTAGPQFASGGFIADSRTGFVINGSQQQFLVRDSAIGGWSNGVWNQVFSGTVGAPAQSFPNPPYTTIAATPVSKEEPYLYVDRDGRWNVRVPSARTSSSGVTWGSGVTPGRSIRLSDFYLARPGDSAVRIDSQLARGKHLLLTPGVYDVDHTIMVKRAGTVVLFRIGGPHVGKASVNLQVNSDNVILDDSWVWRADHGEGVGWTVNTAATGVVVNGDDVTATGLFVEHFQEYNLIWNGERGRTVFFQNELPYDAPDQASWSHDGVNGWAAYKVADSVKQHEAWGLGSYIFTNVNPTLHATNAIEVPVTPGVRMHDLLTVSLNKAGTIDHVINGVGAAVTPDRPGPENVVNYPAVP